MYDNIRQSHIRNALLYETVILCEMILPYDTEL